MSPSNTSVRRKPLSLLAASRAQSSSVAGLPFGALTPAGMGSPFHLLAGSRLRSRSMAMARRASGSHAGSVAVGVETASSSVACAMEPTVSGSSHSGVSRQRRPNAHWAGQCPYVSSDE